MRYSLLLCALFLTGCATIITGTSNDISVSSDPAEAEIEVDGRDLGETPKTITLDSGNAHTLTLNLDGYEKESIQIRKSTSGWVAGNLLLGGIPGFIVDFATGGVYVLKPTTINQNLDRVEDASRDADLHIKVAMNVDRDLRKVAQLVPSERVR